MPTINNNSVFTIWVQNEPNSIVLNCWKSWIDCHYDVTIYVDDAYNRIWKLPSLLHGKVKVKHLRSVGIIPFINEEDKLLHLIDQWRFILLRKLGGTWLDSDLYLISRLPNDPIIISSEHTLKK